uniref:C2H2-type domain-containing protein n=1 Tax=Knipowitschia caucasica TaxID=637954 RepID=A0AAV2LD19_KNICA
MPRRKQSNPQPVKLGALPLDPPLVVDPSCLVLDSDFLLSGELEFGDSEIMGLGKDSVTVFSLVEEDSSVPSDPSLSFCCCKRCGKLLPDALLSTGLHLGVSLDLSSDLYCLSCESIPPSPELSPKSSKRVQNQPDPSPSEPRLYSCALCPFTSRYSNHLTRHARIHQGRKPYQCEVMVQGTNQCLCDLSK